MVSLTVPGVQDVAEHAGTRPTVQVKYVDTNSGGLWVTWRWEHALDRPRLWGIQPAQVAGALAAFRPAVPDPAAGESLRDAMLRSWRVLGDLDREKEVAWALAGALLPQPLGAELNHFLERSLRPHLRIQASAALATVPWEALRVDEGERVVHLADVSMLLPASVRNAPTRAVTPPRPAGPVVATVNPVVPGAIDGFGPVTRRSEPLVERMLAGLGDRLRVTTPEAPVRSLVNRDQLRTLLADAGRFLYVGHVTQGAHALGTSLHLTDGPEAHGRATLVGGTHRPLLASDVALDGWVVPSRVALVACASGGDAGYADPTGLVAAFASRGAEHVTAARWTLPTDVGIEMLAASSLGPASTESSAPYENLARAIVAVDAAHEADDPVAALGAWQREQADAWERTGDPAYSPVVWAALTTAWG
ncbi:CHAT domain-containing protein [Isoptericola sp. F-RaC21]|uniref:CHAT domain-containing protein n=1 Tax=Isoptericola sp. F-RaC21 TaxID=3141452 RepID=UPI00315BF486